MTEEEARAFVRTRFGAAAYERVEQFGAMVASENAIQNLVAASTVEALWTRHIVDSLQLIHLAGDRSGAWLDIGTGGGFPGLVVGLVREERTILVEPRRMRAAFLASAAEALGASWIEVRQAKAGVVVEPASVISARAVARIGALLEMAHQCSSDQTRWLLPRGGSLDNAEIKALGRSWRFMFHVEHSLISSSSRILILDQVQRR